MRATRDARTFDGIEYAPGARYEVLVPARLSGWVAVTGGAGGWRQDLQPGDVLTCTGYGAGMGSDPGYGVEWTSEEAQAARAFHCDLWPQTGGVFAYRPAPGVLRRLTEEETPTPTE